LVEVLLSKFILLNFKFNNFSNFENINKINTVNYKNLNFLFNLIIIMEAINIKYSFMDDYSEGSHPKILEKLIKTNLI